MKSFLLSRSSLRPPLTLSALSSLLSVSSLLLSLSHLLSSLFSSILSVSFISFLLLFSVSSLFRFSPSLLSLLVCLFLLSPLSYLILSVCPLFRLSLTSPLPDLLFCLTSSDSHCHFSLSSARLLSPLPPPASHSSLLSLSSLILSLLSFFYSVCLFSFDSLSPLLSRSSLLSVSSLCPSCPLF